MTRRVPNPLMRRAALVAAAMAAMLASGCGSSASTPSATKTAGPGATGPTVPAPNVPARDRFTGTLSAGTGSLAGAGDLVEARIQAPAASGTRPLTMWILSTGCRPGSSCAHLSGSLRGQLIRVRTLPDIGRRYQITATGSLHPIGAVKATGVVGGTGNIMSGFESLQLALSGPHGSARLIASSARVPSFTSP